VAKLMLCQRRQAFAELDHRLVGEAGQHRMLQHVELFTQRRVDARVGMAEQVHPPGADRIQVAVALMVIQPHAAAMADGNQRHGFVVLHLGARVPD
jgi:hypothetical protein